MPFLKNMGFLMTYTCQVSCTHCAVDAGPHRKENLGLEDAFYWIGQIADYRDGHIKGISIIGGEPFSDMEKLKKMAIYAEAHGLGVSVMTNAFWAETEGEALGVLKGLPKVKKLAISTDIQRQGSIPLERVKNAVLAAKTCEIPYKIAVYTNDEKDNRFKHMLDDLRGMAGGESVHTFVTFPATRAYKRAAISWLMAPEDAPASACRAGDPPIIFPDGKVMACGGPVISLPYSHPFVLGDLRRKPISKILDGAERNAVLHAVRIWGPGKLLSILESWGRGVLPPNKHIGEGHCDACYGLVSDVNTAGLVEELAEDAEFKRMVEFGRKYYLKEKSAS